MYSDKENVNILTALLVQHGVRHIIVCPGSRNSALSHNFNEHPDIICHPVTDERSAGFMALGIALQNRDQLVAVCVTSGSALLNVLPAVAEASYQHCGIIVISADRPSQWINQLDGQTINQVGALGEFVTKTVNLPEPHNEEERWHCNRLVNEAIIALRRDNSPVHINVPVTEPFFSYSLPELPKQRLVEYVDWNSIAQRGEILSLINSSKRPMIVFGQVPYGTIPNEIQEANNKVVILHEPLAVNGLANCFTDQIISVISDNNQEFLPDCLIFFGGNTISKRLRRFMRTFPNDCEVIMVDEDGELRDITTKATKLVHGKTSQVAEDIFKHINTSDTNYNSTFIDSWSNLRAQVEKNHLSFEPRYSSMKAVKLFEQQYHGEIVHYANSMSVRLGAIYSENDYRYCNRGINGIEGSLSTAAGASLALQYTEPKKNIYCVIGDLSFFYDENALWQNQLSGNLRILLLNNYEGAIFRNLKGLENSPARDQIIAAGHSLSAEGICQQFGVTYKKATDEDSLTEGIAWLGSVESQRPVLLEVITSAEEDEKVFKEYYNNLKK